MSDKEEGSLPDSDGSPVHGSPKSRSRSPSPVTRSRSRSLSASRSRSRSPRRRHKRSRSRSRGHRYSRSRSRSPYQRRRHRDSHGERSSGRRRHRSHSRSPMSSRRRHQGNRDDPEPTRCLGVFGLSLHTQERDLREVFDRYGSVEEVQVVYDRQSGRSRGFSFVYFKSVNDAIEAKDRCTGMEIDGRRIRVDYSITERAHTPTPGIYLGKPTTRGERERDRGVGDRYERSDRYDRNGQNSHGSSSYGYNKHYSDDRYNRYRSPSPYRRRSPSPYYGRRRSRSRSRSRSYSPPRFEERNMKCVKNET
ncbi:transformer-2 protein homolog beta-like isoform X1 [Haliotis asinina]|uniref:transformer-2 protein homolog beta-like isoform X1 n=1 Tax=Haliotis asinina TaxID=109174 RepID=UPI003532046C